MLQILLTIPVNWYVYFVLTILGGLLLASAVLQYLRRNRESTEPSDAGVFASIAAGLIAVGVLGMRGTLPSELPIFGYGTTLFVAFVACTALGIYLGHKVGIAPEVFKDVVLWSFVTGILGARVWHFVESRHFPSLGEFFAIWDGGLVLYGGLGGGVLGYFLADYIQQRKSPFDRWKMLDCSACCVALGIAIGRIGCLLNGCCYGNVACSGAPAITFPIAAPPRFHLVKLGYQTPAGFTLDRRNERMVDFVEPNSAASAAKLQAGDVIVKVNGDSVVPEPTRDAAYQMYRAFQLQWPRSKNDLVLTVERTDEAGAKSTIELPPMRPRTLGLHPTQIYETISATLLLFFLLSYFPYRAADGILLAILLLAYGVHRFINEMLRLDNDIFAFNMTLSQNISIAVFLGGVVMSVAVYRHARSRPSSPAVT